MPSKDYVFNKLPRSFVHGDKVVTYEANGSRTVTKIADMFDGESEDIDFEDRFDSEPVKCKRHK